MVVAFKMLSCSNKDWLGFQNHDTICTQITPASRVAPNLLARTLLEKYMYSYGLTKNNICLA